MKFIDLNKQYSILKENIDEKIAEVLSNAQFIMGKEVSAFENEMQDYLGVRHVISCANGTDALTMLYMAHGIAHGDAVFCPDITFIASIEPACLLGAAPVFCDIARDTYNLCPESLERQIKAVQAEGRLRAKAVVAVDFLGNPADYDAIESICKKYHLLLIEDAAQSFGAEYHGKKCGGLGFDAITSFFPAKPLGCYGDGGAVMTDDDEMAETCRSIRIHGKGTSKYDNVRIGINSRLDTIQAAILQVKLNAFKAYEMQARQEAAKRYTDAFSPHLTVPYIAPETTSVYAQFALLAKDENERDAVRKHLQQKEIPSMIYYPAPQHELPVFATLNHYGETFENAKDYCSRTFSIPMHPYLEESVQNMVISSLLDYMTNRNMI